jgi:carboxyl-terminal processing protease
LDHLFKKIRVVNDLMTQAYVVRLSDVQRAGLIQGAISGMVRALDPHSSYLTPGMMEHVKQSRRGDFCGVGLEVSPDETGALQIIAPIDETAAFRAGLRSGDRILKIDGRWIADLSPEESIRQLKGPAGTAVTLTIRRPGKLLFDVVLERHRIHFKSVQSHKVDPKIGYIRISYFDENAKRLTQAALRSFQQASEPLGGILLDLRNNPGGLLEQSIGVADLFLQKGPIVLIRTCENPDGMLVFSNRKPLTSLMSLPLVVLVNAGSASGAEVVAGALKDNNRGVILGEKTFGKASIQAIYPLENGAGVKLTIAHYDPPSGRSIQSQGVEPDIVLLEAPEFSGASGKGESADLKVPAEEEAAPSHSVDLQLTQAINVLQAMMHQNRRLPKGQTGREGQGNETGDTLSKPPQRAKTSLHQTIPLKSLGKNEGGLKKEGGELF